MKHHLYLVLAMVLLPACGTAPVPTVDLEATIQVAVATQVALAVPTQLPESFQEESTQTASEVVPTVPTATVAPEPTPTPAGPTRTRMIGFIDQRGYSALEGLAFLNGLSLDLNDSSDHAEFRNSVEQPDVLVALYGPTEPFDSELYQLSSLVQHGGRVLFLYNERWAEYNQLLQDLFGISVVEEDILGPHLDSVQLDEQSLPSWASGLTVVLAGRRDYNLRSYLMSTLEGGERRYVRNPELEADRLIYLSLENRSITAWPAIIWVREGYPSGYRIPTHFFHDEEIGFMDNEEAAVGLVRYLAGP